MAIKTVDNYQAIENDTNRYYCKFDKPKKYEKDIIGDQLEINLNDYTDKKYPNNTFFSFFKDKEKKKSKNEDDVIISIRKKDGDNYLAQTGNYVGKFKWQGLEIDIKSRFSNLFLERMLNFANDIFLDDVSITGNKVDKDFDISKYIIYYMFVQNLEKAFLLGLPKSYKSINHHEMKLKGKIHINRFIKNDIPFQGKVSSVSREQKEIQEVIDVLYKAIKVIDIESKKYSSKDNHVLFTKNISHIKTHLKQHKSNLYVSNQTIDKALTCKALQNPIFSPYKKVLEYTKYIIHGDTIEEKNGGEQETYGFIINVAELFEIYVTKLLQKEFSDWYIDSPKIPLYETMFYSRKIIPDIVMIRDNDVMVFDTKYKRMIMRGKNQNDAGDVDRNDFFQVNTYMSYYHNQGLHVKVGGLLYPMESYDKSRCHNENWFGNSDTKFIVDGIDLSKKEDLTMNDIVESEKDFIERLRELMK
ncbi:MAG: hypothetical protein EOM50_14660 [Erysipelotrichia bacterium]|nr:hypothetical protein [Erysipelotrichia bacterium]